MNRFFARPLLVAITAASCALAYAANTTQTNDAIANSTAKVSLIQAIGIAEQHVGGKAVRAKLEHSKRRGAAYEVEVAQGTKAFDVRIDPDKGSVISSVEDKADAEDDDD